QQTSELVRLPNELKRILLPLSGRAAAQVPVRLRQRVDEVGSWTNGSYVEPNHSTLEFGGALAAVLHDAPMAKGKPAAVTLPIYLLKSEFRKKHKSVLKPGLAQDNIPGVGVL